MWKRKLLLSSYLLIYTSWSWSWEIPFFFGTEFNLYNGSALSLTLSGISRRPTVDIHPYASRVWPFWYATRSLTPAPLRPFSRPAILSRSCLPLVLTQMSCICSASLPNEHPCMYLLLAFCLSYTSRPWNALLSEKNDKTFSSSAHCLHTLYPFKTLYLNNLLS